MNSSTVETGVARAMQVHATEDTLSVELSDGRVISAPLVWYPRLSHATPKERTSWRLIGSGQGIHWPDLDEDISVANLLSGQPSGESQTSLKKWLATRPRLYAKKPRRDRLPACHVTAAGLRRKQSRVPLKVVTKPELGH